jgi:hypothetical protein
VRQLKQRSTGAGVLLALAVIGAAAGGLRAAETPSRAAAPDLDLVPADAAGFVTARVAGIADKLGLKDARGLAGMVDWQAGFAGVRTTELERFTVIFTTPSDPSDVVSVYHTTKRCDRAAVLKALAPEARPVKRGGKVFHVNANGAAVHFADDRLFIYGPEKRVTEVIGKRGPDAGAPLAAALRQAPGHDVFSWSRAEDPDEAATRAAAKTCVGRGRRTVTACKRSSGGPGDLPPLSDLLPHRGALAVAGDLPMPEGVEAADAFLDLGERTVLGLRLHFADEASARNGAKFVRVARDAARAMLLMAQTEFAAVDSLSGLDDAGGDADYQAMIPLVRGLLPIIRPLEKGLDRAAIDAEGKTVPVVVSVPLGAKKVRTALLSGLAWVAPVGTTSDGTAPLPFRAWTAPAAPAAPAHRCQPSGCPAVPDAVPVLPVYSSPLVGTLPAQASVLPPTVVVAPPAPSQPGTPFMPASNWTPAVSTAPVGCAIPTPPATTAVVPAVAMTTTTLPPAAVKLTVANVTKEAALLFTEGENGKLVFNRKIPAGEAVDVETTAGKRWVAVFADNPAGETHVAASNTPWLLRPAGREPAAPTGTRGSH